MISLQDRFEQAVADSKNLPERPDSGTLLKLYALFKQASAGDAAGARPAATDFVASAKWDAWNKLRGTSSTDAMEKYVALIDELKEE